MRGPETVACIGWSHRTPDAAFWTDGRLRVTKDHPGWLGLEGWEHDYGDGTVPSYSALPIELDNHEHSPVRLLERHVPLAHSGVVAELLDRQRRRLPPSAAQGCGRDQGTVAAGLAGTAFSACSDLRIYTSTRRLTGLP